MDGPPERLAYAERDMSRWLETLQNLRGDLDPDIAMWPVTVVQRWPFCGHPTEGIWPTGWIGVDNTPTIFICLEGGEPGHWQEVVLGDPDLIFLRQQVDDLLDRVSTLEAEVADHETRIWALEHP